MFQYKDSIANLYWDQKPVDNRRIDWEEIRKEVDQECVLSLMSPILQTSFKNL